MVLGIVNAQLDELERRRGVRKEALPEASSAPKVALVVEP